MMERHRNANNSQIRGNWNDSHYKGVTWHP